MTYVAVMVYFCLTAVVSLKYFKKVRVVKEKGEKKR